MTAYSPGYASHGHAQATGNTPSGVLAKGRNREARLVGRLGSAKLQSASAVRRLHEMLCWIRAYPDDARVLDVVNLALRDFAARKDLQRYRNQLADSGIAGTAIHYHFFWPMARWLSARWPTLLYFDRDCGEGEDWLRTAWPVALPGLHAEAAKRSERSPFRILDTLRVETTDASFFVQGIDHTAGDTLHVKACTHAIQPAYVLQPGRDSPSRTRAYWSAGIDRLCHGTAGTRAPGSAQGVAASTAGDCHRPAPRDAA